MAFSLAALLSAGLSAGFAGTLASAGAPDTNAIAIAQLKSRRWLRLKIIPSRVPFAALQPHPKFSPARQQDSGQPDRRPLLSAHPVDELLTPPSLPNHRGKPRRNGGAGELGGVRTIRVAVRRM